jgi:hypothetical protein
MSLPKSRKKELGYTSNVPGFKPPKIVDPLKTNEMTNPI